MADYTMKDETIAVKRDNNRLVRDETTAILALPITSAAAQCVDHYATLCHYSVSRLFN